MMEPFYALIVPQDSISPPVPNPPGIWGGGNEPFPTPPIANVPGAPGYTPPGSPPGIWGPLPGFPTPPIANVPGVPGYRPPGIWGPLPGFPTPPIYLPPGYPGSPPGIWGPLPGFPTPPIANVPGVPGYNPPGIWGGGNEPFPTPPIVIPVPPDVEIPPEIPPDKMLVIVWSPGLGWTVAVVPKPPGYNPPSGGNVPQPVEETPPV